MTIIVFILVLSFLIFIHELGHFLFAKKAGVRVDEFAIGFPPKLYGYKPEGSETEYVLNLIPFGGYVKIYGENGTEEEEGVVDTSKSMTHKSRLWQVLILSGGVLFNIILAWILFSFAFMLGNQVAIEPKNEQYAENPRLMIVAVSPDSPAFEIGLQPGDVISSVNGQELFTPEEFQTAIRSSEGSVDLSLIRGGEIVVESVAPREGVVVEDVRAIGVAIDKVGTVKLPLFPALYEGGVYTVEITRFFVESIADLLQRFVMGDASLKELSGPIGIAKLSGDAASQGFATLLSFTALLSLNLAILNILPFPALDGGRIIVLGIEAVRRKNFKPSTLQWVNGFGFILLILLMVAVTIQDILNIF
jgi:regulator of sigma E protease